MPRDLIFKVMRRFLMNLAKKQRNVKVGKDIRDYFLQSLQFPELREEDLLTHNHTATFVVELGVGLQIISL